MAVPRPTAAERAREAKEEAQRKSRLGLRLGALGVVVLFGSGFGAWLAVDYILLFLVGMVLGIVLVLAAFFLVRSSIHSLEGEAPTKIL
jgi:divalent metal cation (Fe/Co/Zn/Cd) transporter